MRIAGGGSGGHFVGLDPAAASGLTQAMASAGGRCATAANQIGSLLAVAGPDAGGATTPQALGSLDRWLDGARADVRWRVAVLTESGFAASGGLLLGTFAFASAAEAEAAGRHYAQEMKAALDASVFDDVDGAMEEYLRLAQAAGVFSDDPAWAGGLVNELGSDGLGNVVWFAQGEVEGDVEATHRIIAPVAATLATAMRARTSAPALQRELLRWPNYRLGVLLTASPPETKFLAEAAKTRFIDTAWNDDPFDDLIADEAALFLEALSGNAEASHRVLTAKGPAGEPGVVDILRALPSYASGAAEQSAAVVLQQGLVSHPAAAGAAAWNDAVEATEAVIAISRYLPVDAMHDDFSTSLLHLLPPHLDAVAGIGIESSDMSRGHYDIDVPLPGGRQSLDVAPEDLQKFLGQVLQHDRTIAQMQAMLAGYAQSDRVQHNRLPLIEPDGRVADLEPLMADSLRIAGLMGIVGQGLDLAGHDEEARTRLLTGALKTAGSKGVGRVIGWTGPLGWAAKETAGKGVDLAADRFRDWMETFEPIEGEDGVDAFLKAYDDNTAASLREAMAQDPRLAALSAAEQQRTLAHATRLAGDMVRANLLEVYAELTGETAKELK